MPVRTIQVGCKVFGRTRLQAHIACSGLEPVACVDIDVEGARDSIRSLGGATAEMLADRVYGTIAEARAEHDADACLIFASTPAHSQLVVESLGLGMHILCVKPIAVTQAEFRQVTRAHRERPELVLVQGQNKRWNPAATKMRQWLREEDGIGEMLGGECRFWVRLDLRDEGRIDAQTEGTFFPAAASHQLDQLVAAKGLPKHVTAHVHRTVDADLGQTGVWGTTGGQALFEYANGAPFSYTGTRAGHADEEFVGWSGHWRFHGENGDIVRDSGRLQLIRKGELVEDLTLPDIHPELIDDDRIQFEAFAFAITTGKDRDWLQESTLDTWVLMEACNESARTGNRIDVGEFRSVLMN